MKFPEKKFWEGPVQQKQKTTLQYRTGYNTAIDDCKKLNPEIGLVPDQKKHQEKQWDILGGPTYQEIKLMTESLAKNNKQHLENVIKTLGPTLELAFRRGVDEGKSIEKRSKESGLVELDEVKISKFLMKEFPSHGKVDSIVTDDVAKSLCSRFGSKRLPTVEEIEKAIVKWDDNGHDAILSSGNRKYLAKAIHAEISKSSEKKDIKII